MQIYTQAQQENFVPILRNLAAADGPAVLTCDIPPLFTLSDSLIQELEKAYDRTDLLSFRNESLKIFRHAIKDYKMDLQILDPELALAKGENFRVPLAAQLTGTDLILTREQYQDQIRHLKHFAAQYPNLTLTCSQTVTPSTLLYIKEDMGMVMASTGAPMIAFFIKEPNMVNAFWDYAHTKEKIR